MYETPSVCRWPIAGLLRLDLHNLHFYSLLSITNEFTHVQFCCCSDEKQQNSNDSLITELDRAYRPSNGSQPTPDQHVVRVRVRRRASVSRSKVPALSVPKYGVPSFDLPKQSPKIGKPDNEDTPTHLKSPSLKQSPKAEQDEDEFPKNHGHINVDGKSENYKHSNTQLTNSSYLENPSVHSSSGVLGGIGVAILFVVIMQCVTVAWLAECSDDYCNPTGPTTIRRKSSNNSQVTVPLHAYERSSTHWTVAWPTLINISRFNFKHQRFAVFEC